MIEHVPDDDNADAKQEADDKLVARYRDEGETAFEPRSRRPKTSPTATPPTTVDLILRLRGELAGQGLDAGPDTIGWHLQTHHQITVSTAAIARKLFAAGVITPEPKKRPHSTYVRFEAELPNECWQSDFAHYPLSTGTIADVISWLDDCVRYALSVTAHPTITGPIVLSTFRETTDEHGIPASTLTDNGMVYTTRFAGGKAAAAPSNTNNADCTSSKKTAGPTTPPPAAKSNASNKP